MMSGQLRSDASIAMSASATKPGGVAWAGGHASVRSRVIAIAVLAAIGAAVSLAVTGYQFGILNNLFHLPIVADLYDEPQFAQDPFIQSLRYFSSGIWMLLDGSARYISPYWLFLLGDYLSRVLSFVGLLACGALLGLRTRRELALFTVALCFASLLRGYAYPGDGGLFINYFTHSEIANGTILLALFCAARHRFSWALIFVGLTGFINAFMAVWALFPLAAMAVLVLARRRMTLRQLAVQVVLGGVGMIVLMMPVILNVVHNPDFGAHLPIDFRVFLRAYFPDHVIFAVATPRHVLALAVTVVYGLVCAAALGPEADWLVAAMLGSLVLLALGILAPMLTGMPLILNLHLVRSTVLLYLLAALASAVLGARWMASADRVRSRMFGPILLLANCSWRSFLPLGIVVIGVQWASARMRWRLPAWPLTYPVLALLVLVVWPKAIWPDVATNRDIAESTSAWTSVGEWARNATPASATFMVPIEPLVGDATSASVQARKDGPETHSEMFEFVSHRRIWVDNRRGAAVLWSPSYYPIWWSRVRAVLALTTLPDRIRYARENGIGYVVDACPENAAMRADAVFANGGLCVFDADRGKDHE
jgi:hypothetical protein